MRGAIKSSNATAEIQNGQPNSSVLRAVMKINDGGWSPSETSKTNIFPFDVEDLLRSGGGEKFSYLCEKKSKK